MESFHQPMIFLNIGLGNIIYKKKRYQFNIQRATRLSPFINNKLLEWKKSHEIKDKVEIEFPETEEDFKREDVSAFFKIINGNHNIIENSQVAMFKRISEVLKINAELLFSTLTTAPNSPDVMINIHKLIRMTDQSDETVENTFIKDSILISHEFMEQNFNDIWTIYKRAYQKKAIDRKLMCPIMHTLIDIHKWNSRNIVDALTSENGFNEEEIDAIIYHLLECIKKGSLEKMVTELIDLFNKNGLGGQYNEILNSIYQKCVTENEALKRQIADDNIKLLELERKLRNIENDPQFIIFQIFLIENHIETIIPEYNQLKEKRKAKEAFTDQEKEEYRELIQKIRESQNKKKDMNEQLDQMQLNAEISALRKNLNTNEIKNLRKENQRLKKENEKLQNSQPQPEKTSKKKGENYDINSLKERIKFLEEENALLKTAVEITDATFKDAIDSDDINMVKVFLHCDLDKCKNTNIYGIPPLLYAASRKKDKAIKVMLEYGFDPNVKDSKGRNLIYYIIDSPKKIKRYCDVGTSIDVKDIDGKTPLHIATNPDSVLTLIDLGAEIDAVDNDGVTPLINALINILPEVAKLLKDKGANLNAKTNNNENILHLSTKSPQLQTFFTEVFDKFTIEQMNEQDSSGNTPLHNALENDATKATIMMLKKKVDVGIQNNEGETPLTISIKKLSENDQMKKKITGAIVNRTNNTSYSNNNGETPLSLSIKNDNLDDNICIKILEKDERKDQEGIMHSSLEHKKFKLTLKLIDGEWDMDSIDDDNNGIVLCLVGDSSEDAKSILEYAISHGASINKRNKHGETPIRKAVRTKDTDFLDKALDNESFDPSSMTGDSNIIIDAMKQKLPEDSIMNIINHSPPSVRSNEAFKDSISFGIEKISTAILLDDSDLNGVDVLNDSIEAGFEELSIIEMDHGASPFYKMSGLSSIFHTADKGWTMHTKKIFDMYQNQILNEKDTNNDNIFIHSLKNNQFEIVEHIININPSIVDQKNEKGDTPLVIAALVNLVDGVDILLKHGANVTATNESGMSPLGISIMAQHVEIIKRLLDYLKKNDANRLKEVVNQKIGDKTPLKLSIASCPEIAIDLLDCGAECQDSNELEEETPLMLVLQDQEGKISPELFRKLLKASDVNKQNKDGNTAAMVAADNENYNGYITLVTEMDDEIDHTIRNKKKQLVTHILASHSPTVEAIEVTKASWMQSDGNGNIPIIMMMDKDPEAFGAALKKISKEALLGMRFGKEGNTLAHEAIRLNKAQLLPYMKILLKEPNGDGMTSIHYAAMIDNAEAIEVLYNIDHSCINEQRIVKEKMNNERGFIPQHTAVIFGSRNAFSMLLKLGINIDDVSFLNGIDKRKTALMLAIEQRPVNQMWQPSAEFIQYLIDNKACAKSIELARKNGLNVRTENVPRTPPVNKTGAFGKPTFAKPTKDNRNALNKVKSDPNIDCLKVSFIEDEFEQCLKYVSDVTKDAEVMWILLKAYSTEKPIFHMLVETENESLLGMVMATNKNGLIEEDSEGRTALMKAVENNNLNMTKILLSKKFGINIRNKQNGCSAPFYAKSPEMLKFIIETDTIDYSIRTNEGISLLEYVIRNFDLENEQTAEVIQMILSKTNAFDDGKASNNGWLLHLAYERRMCEVVYNVLNTAFLKNVMEIDGNGRTIFHAVLKTWIDGVSTLISICKDKNLLSHKDNNGKTPIDLAVEELERIDALKDKDFEKDKLRNTIKLLFLTNQSVFPRTNNQGVLTMLRKLVQSV